MDKIITTHIYPPIPDRRYDWCAYHDCDVEVSHHYGWGRTEAEAIADLHRIDDERAEWAMVEACRQGSCNCTGGWCELDEQLAEPSQRGQIP